MKKVLKYFSVMLMVLILSVGCGQKEETENTLESAISNMKETKSLSAKISVIMKMENFSSETGFEIEIDVDDNDNYYKLSSGIFNNERYVINDDDYQYEYRKLSDGWKYVKTKKSDLNDIKFVDSLNNMLNNMKDIKEVESDKDGYKKIEFKLDSSTFNELMVGLKIDWEVPYKIDSDIGMYLYIKDGHLAIIEIDLRDSLLKMNDTTYSKYNIIVELSNFNGNEKIELPQNIADSAVEQ